MKMASAILLHPHSPPDPWGTFVLCNIVAYLSAFLNWHIKTYSPISGKESSGPPGPNKIDESIYPLSYVAVSQWCMYSVFVAFYHLQITLWLNGMSTRWNIGSHCVQTTIMAVFDVVKMYNIGSLNFPTTKHFVPLYNNFKLYSVSVIVGVIMWFVFIWSLSK